MPVPTARLARLEKEQMVGVESYEELEDYEKARRSYEFFIQAWQDADPALQPMVEEARAAAKRLRSVIRE